MMPITSSPPKWMAELENDDIDMLKELGSLTTANLMEKVRGLQNLAYQLGLDEWKDAMVDIDAREMTRGKFLNILEKPKNMQVDGGDGERMEKAHVPSTVWLMPSSWPRAM
ncbi:hypothetical protein IHE44_0013822 [Lamprotornis superbus]|uniref:Protein lin-52 homolog n=1 Tax=Lamprotornis superbus TaxID=245042 RepID=A0A835TWG7_9PASS|nr:hypothetical protein IHE44_0013822 [Lamprotornis superbus]